MHAHVQTISADCDGQYDRSHVADLLDHEEDDAFVSRMISQTVSAYGYGGRLDVKVDESTGLAQLEWSEPTDEGYSHVEVTFCRGLNCASDRPTFRDHTAERAGY